MNWSIGENKPEISAGLEENGLFCEKNKKHSAKKRTEAAAEEKSKHNSPERSE